MNVRDCVMIVNTQLRIFDLQICMLQSSSHRVYLIMFTTNAGHTTMYAFSKSTIDAIKNASHDTIKQYFDVYNINVVIDMKYINDARVDIYDAEIYIAQELSFIDVQNIAKIMHMFCTTQAEIEFYANDKRYVIGDGDDAGACTMRGNVIRLWVRQFDEYVD